MSEGAIDQAMEEGAQRVLDEEGDAPDLVEAMALEQRILDRYKGLRRVLEEALLDASDGKGARRHGSPAPFEDQPMLLVRGLVGPGFTRGQALKKIIESRGLAPMQAARELRHAIIYLAGEILALEAEERDA